MKLVFSFPSRVLATIALSTCSVAAFASPGAPAPPVNSIRFTAPDAKDMIASPGAPAPPVNSIRFAAAESNLLS